MNVMRENRLKIGNRYRLYMGPDDFIIVKLLSHKNRKYICQREDNQVELVVSKVSRFFGVIPNGTRTPGYSYNLVICATCQWSGNLCETMLLPDGHSQCPKCKEVITDPPPKPGAINY